MSKTLQSIQAEFAQQSIHPPDPYIGAFNSAISQLLTEDTTAGKLLTSFLNQVFTRRKYTPTHFVNLFFRACQHLILYQDGKTYPKRFDRPMTWRKTILTLINKKSVLLKEILLEKKTTTTKYQRYSSIKYFLSLLAKIQPKIFSRLEVVDLACGGNHGLPGISLGYEFESINGEFAKNHLASHLSQPISLKRKVALDLVDPQNFEAKIWRRSCSFYPSELNEMADFVKFEEEIYSRDQTTFIQGDIRRLPAGLGKFHLVSILTALYQMSPQDVRKTFTQVQKILKPNGLLVIQDFAKKDSRTGKLSFSESWFKEKYAYRTFIRGKLTQNQFWEVFRWKNSRCREVLPGTDFPKLLAILNS